MSANTGATYYAVNALLGIEFTSSIALYGLLLLAVLAAQRAYSRDSVIIILAFGSLTAYFILTSYWAEGELYREHKLLRTIIAPPLWILAGYAIARRGAVTLLAKVTALFSLTVAAAVSFSGPALTDSLASLLTDQSLVFDYQRLGIVAGLGAATVLPAVRKNLWLVVFIVLATMALVSGGRTGVLLILTAGSVWLAYRVSIKVWLPVLAGGVAAVWLGTDMILVFLGDVAQSLNAPDTVQRAIAAAERPPDLTRVWGRVELSRAGIELWLENPFLGVGWSGFPAAAGLPDLPGFYPHNVFIELLSETGLVGMTATVVVATLFIHRRRLISVQSQDDRRQLMIIDTLFFCGLASAQFVGDWPTFFAMFLAAGGVLGLRDRPVARRAVGQFQKNA